MTQMRVLQLHRLFHCSQELNYCQHPYEGIVKRLDTFTQPTLMD
jgi:hypothetical protein